MSSSMSLEELYSTLVRFSRGLRAECAEVPATAGLRVLLSRVESVLAGCELSDHGVLTAAASWRSRDASAPTARPTRTAIPAHDGQPRPSAGARAAPDSCQWCECQRSANGRRPAARAPLHRRLSLVRHYR